MNKKLIKYFKNIKILENILQISNSKLLSYHYDTSLSIMTLSSIIMWQKSRENQVTGPRKMTLLRSQNEKLC